MAFKIRQIFDHSTELNAQVIDAAKLLLLSQFPYMKEQFLDELVEIVKANSNSKVYRHYLFVAENKGLVSGAAIATHFLPENFFFVDYVASSKDVPSRGIGAALYSRIKEQSLINKCIGVFLECENIDRRFCASDEEQKQNKIRLNFYRRFGAVQLIDSKYEKWRRGDSSLHLLFDNNHRRHPDSKALEKIVKAILVSHGPEKCSEDYIKEVVASLKESHFEKLPKHLSSPQRITSSTYHKVPDDQKIPLTLNPLHRIHHVTEKGYVESPIRIDAILKELDKVNYFELKKTKHFPDSHITEVHDPQYFQFLKDICKYAGKKTMYPDVFPIRNRARLPLGLEEQAGYYCMDVYSPINQNAYLSSRAAVDCALTAAETLVEGENVAYALVRPPGHHAERRFFGGFCYLNSTAIAAHFLSKHGRVAILDVDYHHGNGQQNIFYERPDVLTVSIHGHPEHAYPHFTGFEDEKGEGLGLNYNVNHPLPLTMDGPTYLKTLKVAAEQILKFDPSYVVVALGLDTAKGDPTGTWKLLARDFEENGFQIGGLQKPTLVVQEGGYRTQVLGVNVRHFFRGLMKGYYQN